MKKKEQFSIALWDRLKKYNIPHSFESRDNRLSLVFGLMNPIKENKYLYVFFDTHGNVYSFTEQGSYIYDAGLSETDLFIVWEEEQLMLEGWLNIYDGVNNTIGYAYKDKISADELAGPTRIACVKVSIPYTKGEGLENG